MQERVNGDAIAISGFGHQFRESERILIDGMDEQGFGFFSAISKERSLTQWLESYDFIWEDQLE